MSPPRKITGPQAPFAGDGTYGTDGTDNPQRHADTVPEGRPKFGDTDQFSNVSPPTVAAPVAQRGKSRFKTTDSFGEPGQLSPVVVLHHLATKLSRAPSLEDALVYCNESKGRNLPEAEAIGQWLRQMAHGRCGDLTDELANLPYRELLEPIVLPILLNNLAYRIMGLSRLDPGLPERARLKLTELTASGPPQLWFDDYRRFVRAEESRSQRIVETSAPPEWVEEAVSPSLRAALDRLFDDKEFWEQATDMGRLYQAFSPLDCPLPPIIKRGRLHMDTEELAYGHYNGLWQIVGKNELGLDDNKELGHELLRYGTKDLKMFNAGDYWLARGSKVSKGGKFERTGRYYLTIEPDHAKALLQALDRLWNKWVCEERTDIQEKMTHRAEDLLRLDAALAYFNIHHQEILFDLVALTQEKPEFFRRVPGPITTAQILDDRGNLTGISFAESPKDFDKSHGGRLAEVVSTAIRAWRCRQAADEPVDRENLYRMIAYGLKQHLMDTTHPAFSLDPRTSDPSGIEAFVVPWVMSNQFVQGEIPLVLEMVEKNAKGKGVTGSFVPHEIKQVVALFKAAKHDEVIAGVDRLLGTVNHLTPVAQPLRALKILAQREMAKPPTPKGGRRRATGSLRPPSPLATTQPGPGFLQTRLFSRG